MTALLTVEKVSRSFGSVTALDDVSFEIGDNEFFALLGPSGCGKTTLLRSIAGFESPDAGSIRLDGTDLIGVAPHRRPVNLMFQSYALFPHMTVEKNVAYGLEAEALGSGEIRTRVYEVLETVGLVSQAKRRPHQLSGGQRQRVALARAIVKRPRLLLLDEPLSALDRKVRADMQLELKRLQHEVGLTFVVVTHDQEEAMSMADRVLVMNGGKVEQLDSPVDLYHHPRSRFVADFIGTSNLFDGVAADGGVEVTGLGLVAATEPGPSGRAATAVLRPEQVRVSEAGTGTWDGVVQDAAFLGGRTTLAVRVPGRAAPVLATIAGVTSVRRGDTVGLGWTVDDVVVTPGAPEVAQTAVVASAAGAASGSSSAA